MSLKSIGALLGDSAKKEKTETKRVAVSHLWRGDFIGAPEWFMNKYFVNSEGSPCGRMYVKHYAKLGFDVCKDGKPVFTKTGKRQKLTTAYLAKVVEEDLEKIGKPMKVHFKGYDLDPIHYVMLSPVMQEEYEENEKRNVPGLDEDEVFTNGTKVPLDKEAYEYISDRLMCELIGHRLIQFGLDEEFGKLALPDFVYPSVNAELLDLKKRLEDLYLSLTQELRVNVSEGKPLNIGDDWDIFDENDNVRTYTRAYRTLFGKELGEPMLDEVKALNLDNLSKDKLTLLYRIGMNEDPTETEVLWEEEERLDLFDDDSGEALTELCLDF